MAGGRARTGALGRGPQEAGRAALVVLAGGSGTRVGADLNKVYLPLAGRRVVSWSFIWASTVPEIGHFVLVVRPQDADLARETLRREVADLTVDLVVGGSTRHDSELSGLGHLRDRVDRGEVEVVALHDAARPLAGPALFRTVVTTAATVGGALPALPAEGMLAVHPAGEPTAAGEATGARGVPVWPATNLARVQTPQAFRAKELVAAYDAASAAGYQGTDTACSVEVYSDLVVQVVAGSRHNLKVTYPHDLVLAERLLVATRHRLP